MSLSDPGHSVQSDNAVIHGQRLGRYELYYRIGTGGMASVYLGRLSGEIGFERWVAIKQIHEHLADDKTFRDMFLDEARVAALMNHPNLVQVTDIGLEQGRPYLVMEFVRGETLAAILKRCRAQNIRLPIPIGARIIAWACDGLHHAHELKGADGEPKNLVHRDLSPHNILVSYEGVVKVADFGIAKAAGRTSHTRTGFIKGKPQYMSPEQALAKPLDRRSDIFSLGILLYETTLGRRLFQEESEFETFRRITEGDFPRPRALDRTYPPELEEILLKALSIRPSERHSSARELQLELETFLLQTKRPLATGAVSEYISRLFEDRVEAHEELLAWARSNSSLTPPEAPRQVLEHQTGSSELELEAPPQAAPEPELLLETLEPPKTKKSNHFKLIAIIAALFLAVVSGALVLRVVLPQASEVTDDSNVSALIHSTGTSETTPLLRPDASVSVSQTKTEDSGIRGSAVGQDKAPTDADPVAQTPPATPSAAKQGEPLVFTPEDVDQASDGDSEPQRSDGNSEPQRTKRSPRRQPPRTQPAEPEPPGRGTISVMATPWCEVILNGRRLGRTPLMSVSVEAGRHVLHLLPRGERPGRRRVIRVRPNQLTPVSVNFND